MNKTLVKAKEDFVSNSFGTTPTEVFIVGTTPILSCMLYAAVKLKFELVSRSGWQKRTLLFFIELIMLVFLPFLSATLLSDFVIHMNIMMGLLIWIATKGFFTKQCYKHLSNSIYSNKNYFLTNYKAQIQICTAICILAVDFNIFPRRFAKAEVYGIGVMDMAVGSIILSNALTSTQARSHQKILAYHVLRNLKNSLWLFLLGVLRVALVKGSSYQEHVTEYGLHWNFFFTLALVKPLATAILYILPWCQNQLSFLLLSFASIVTYQIMLSKYGLTDIIQNGILGDKSRTTFLDANREGIFSCVGNLSIYFVGLFIGRQIFKEKVSLNNKLIWLLAWSSASWILMHASIIFVTPISRQMSNISYYLLQISCNTYLLFGYAAIDVIYESAYFVQWKKTDSVKMHVYPTLAFMCRAINRNQLLYFLLANACTGLINFTIDTLHSTKAFSYLIHAVYLCTLNLTIWVLYTFQL